MIPIRFSFAFKALFFFLLLLNNGDGVFAQINIASTGTYNGSSGDELFSLNTTGASQMIHNFAILDPTNATQIIAGDSGKLYGLVTAGGPDQSGGIFSVNEDGSSFKLIFNYPVGQSSVEFGYDGKLYLIIKEKLYSIDTTGGNFTLITNLPGAFNTFTVVKGGWLYGSGQKTDTAYLFKIKTDGASYQVLHTFNRQTDGYWEGKQALALSPTGRLYGTCKSGGAKGAGTLFSLKTNGSDFNIHYSFSNSETIAPPLENGRLACSNGKVFFASSSDGNTSSIDKLIVFDTLSSVLTSIFSFPNKNSIFRVNPIATSNKIVGIFNDGLYSINQDGSGFLKVKSFLYQNNSLINSVLYNDKKNSIFYIGGGGIFKNSVLSKTDYTGLQDSTLHNFGNVPGGYNPAGITKGTGKTIYGITQNGGVTGGGTIYKVNQDGTGFFQLHDFADNNGQIPGGQLLLGADGKLYGVCYKSGNAGMNDNDLIYSIDTTGANYSVLRIFDEQLEGDLVPELTFGNNGILYGTTSGTSKSLIFKINKNGSGYGILKTFNPSGLEGITPLQSMVYYNGYLYGICAFGGQNGGGVIFRISENGSSFSLLQQFSFYDALGALPLKGLFLASNKKIYGTTLLNGTNGHGIIFSINPLNLAFTTIYNFTKSDGYNNSTRFIEGSDNRLYTNKYDRLFSIDTTFTNPLTFLFNKNIFKNDYLLEIDANSNTCEGGSVQFTSGITGAGYTFQWQFNDGTGFTNLVNDVVYAGVNDSILRFSNVPSYLINNTYRCAINTGDGIVFTHNYLLNFQNVWTGAIDTDWNKANNWSCGTVPGANSNVVIPSLKSKYPFLSLPVKCKSLLMQKGSNLNITNGVNVELTGKNN